ncbi:small acid-soluble spore protein SspI [Tepidibacillus infernus]|uniref:Small, acid-soluble spore protein I n=1 Tax=Tepidibacillus decaturensis TaxID=1413211 RepID=A0A135L1S4_9BACI|nr:MULTISPECIES: small acid-soluble spore protein SspI [Tepidibacillus]KXG42906.1 small, acid-soluble spore protein I [Tepidibacillus decaturensis]GBF12432.1 small, acid-soluble spore protein I [Tepidibacillus sp. HK-1]
MNIDLRQAIIQNIKGKDEEQLKDMINTAIKDHEEKTLPGLGVLFEVIWQHSDSQSQNEMIDALSKNI